MTKYQQFTSALGIIFLCIWDALWPDEATKHLTSEVVAPIEEWFTLQISLVAGDASSGRVTVNLIRESGEELRLFDVSNATLYPQGVVQGFTSLNPIKLYTSDNLMCWLKSQGLLLDAHWDDFVLELPSQP